MYSIVVRPVEGVFKKNPGFRIIPEFEALDPEVMTFVQFVADPLSPVRRYWLQQVGDLEKADYKCRKDVAEYLQWTKDYIFNNNKYERIVKGGDQKVEKAIKKYRDLCPADSIEKLMLTKKKYEEILDQFYKMSALDTGFSKIDRLVARIVNDNLLKKIDEDLAAILVEDPEPVQRKKPKRLTENMKGVIIGRHKDLKEEDEADETQEEPQEDEEFIPFVDRRD